MASESIAASWAIDSEPIQARGIIMLIIVGTTFSHIGLIQDIHQDFHGYNSRSKLTYVRLLQSANGTIGHQLILLK